MKVIPRMETAHLKIHYSIAFSCKRCLLEKWLGFHLETEAMLLPLCRPIVSYIRAFDIIARLACCVPLHKDNNRRNPIHTERRALLL